MWRKCWGCDCDGVSHRAGGYPATGPQRAVAGALGHIEEVTGRRPPTCPWRAFYDPLVRRVIDIMLLSTVGGSMAELGDDPPAILLDALKVYVSSRQATERYYRPIDRKKAEADAKAKRR